jgi:hypothetical protein
VRKYELVFICNRVRGKIKVFWYGLKYNLAALASKLIHRQLVQCFLKLWICIDVTIIDGLAHSKNASELTITRKVYKIDTLDVDALEAVMRKRKNINRQVKP